MARAANTADVFHAISEPRRRAIIDLLRSGEPTAVGSLVDSMRLPQPAVSKHLSVLRRAGLVSVSREGQRRLYSLNAGGLKPVHDWIKAYERYWTGQLNRIQERAERLARERMKQDRKTQDEGE